MLPSGYIPVNEKLSDFVIILDPKFKEIISALEDTSFEVEKLSVELQAKIKKDYKLWRFKDPYSSVEAERQYLDWIKGTPFNIHLSILKDTHLIVYYCTVLYKKTTHLLLPKDCDSYVFQWAYIKPPELANLKYRKQIILDFLQCNAKKDFFAERFMI